MPKVNRKSSLVLVMVVCRPVRPDRQDDGAGPIHAVPAASASESEALPRVIAFLFRAPTTSFP